MINVYNIGIVWQLQQKYRNYVFVTAQVCLGTAYTILCVSVVANCNLLNVCQLQLIRS